MNLTDNNKFQKIMIFTHKYFIPRGHSRVTKFIAKIYPNFTKYRAVMKNGDKLYLDLTENMCLGYFYFGEIPYETNYYSVIEKILQPDNTFIDIGANIGYYSRVASNLVGKNGNIFSFEPLPNAFRLLKLNCLDLTNVKYYNYAIGDSDAQAPFFINKSGDASSFIDIKNRHSINVTMRRLDTFISLFKDVDLIKIDVEGYEYHVLAGAKNIINSFSPIIIFEYLNLYSDISKINFTMFCDYFAQFIKQEYLFFGINEKKKNHYINRVYNNQTDIGNYLAIPKNKLNVLGKLL